MIDKSAGGRSFGVLVILVLAGLACNASSANGEPTADPQATSPAVEQPATLSPTPVVPDAESVGISNEDLASATVQIFAMNPAGDQWDRVWTGSGSIISSDGIILTNAHVVDNRLGEYSDLGIAITVRSDEPPDLRYLAQIEAVDYTLDLAVIRVISDLNGNPVTPELPYISIGDSDVLGIGAELRILGYPGIGGNTITFTEGAVSGFTQERGIEGRAWIKTDATIAGGNSGGMAVNREGELVGVPTRASATDDEGQIVDCRSVVDTNRDGIIDDNDTCVPIGGFLNGVRPINLAAPLISAVLENREYAEGTSPPVVPTGGYDISAVDFFNLDFADGVTEDDQPTQYLYALSSGVEQICAFWDYEGMQDGMIWSAIWFVNEQPSDEGSFIDSVWQGGATGNWWVCVFDDNGLDDGIYELVLEVEGDSFVNEAVFIGGNRTVVDFTIENNSLLTLCYVNLSASSAQNWGQDELGPTEVIDPGTQRSITVATGSYDLLIRDCEGDTLLDDFELEVSDDFVFTVTD